MNVLLGGKSARFLGAMVLVAIPLGANAKTSSHGSHVERGGSSAHVSPLSASTHAGATHQSTSHGSEGRTLHGGAKNAFFAARHGGKAHLRYASIGGAGVGGSGGGISCVPFAREVSGIELSGNAATWWDEAEGVYARGSRPETGSVLNFRANASMHLGHVAVVSSVVSSREIQIDHANWWGPGATKGGISRNIPVVDVSPNNDWSAVRVGLGHTGDYGSIYPTYGFIYGRHTGTAAPAVVTETSTVPAPSLNPAPRDLRSKSDRRKAYNLVAEAPAGRAIDLSIMPISLDAPDRSFR